MEALNRASFTSKDKTEIPKGAKITKKDISINVEEIENGFLVSKSMDITYEINKETKYKYCTKKYYSKDNPLTIDIKGMDDKSLADNFK